MYIDELNLAKQKKSTCTRGLEQHTFQAQEYGKCGERLVKWWCKAMTKVKEERQQENKRYKCTSERQ